MSIREPIIIEPPGRTPKDGWDKCHAAVEERGGFGDGDQINIGAAFVADPGVCTCPNCHEHFWAWGTKLECTECHFQFPTDWWGMYSHGVAAARRIFVESLHQERLQNPYYQYGFEHPVADAWGEHEKIPWKQIMEGDGQNEK